MIVNHDLSLPLRAYEFIQRWLAASAVAAIAATRQLLDSLARLAAGPLMPRRAISLSASVANPSWKHPIGSDAWPGPADPSAHLHRRFLGARRVPAFPDVSGIRTRLSTRPPVPIPAPVPLAADPSWVRPIDQDTWPGPADSGVCLHRRGRFRASRVCASGVRARLPTRPPVPLPALWQRRSTRCGSGRLTDVPGLVSPSQVCVYSNNFLSRVTCLHIWFPGAAVHKAAHADTCPCGTGCQSFAGAAD